LERTELRYQLEGVAMKNVLYVKESNRVSRAALYDETLQVSANL
jgi:hypothetical protein